MSTSREVTRILEKLQEGDAGAADQLLPLVYNELRQLAASQMREERTGHTLQPTALVHEAFIRLVQDDKARWENRAHFFGAAAKAMRRILVEYARNRLALKRGGGKRRVNLDQEMAEPEKPSPAIIAVDEALPKLEARDPRKSKIVELRFFVGLSIDEISKVLNMSPRTVKREWSYARAWLYREVSGG